MFNEQKITEREDILPIQFIYTKISTITPKIYQWNKLSFYIAFKIEILLIGFLATLDIRKMHYERIKNEINYIYQKSPSRKISVVQ